VLLKLLLYIKWPVRLSLPIALINVLYNYVVQWGSVFINKTTATAIAVDYRLFALNFYSQRLFIDFYSRLLYALTQSPLLKIHKNWCVLDRVGRYLSFIDPELRGIWQNITDSDISQEALPRGKCHHWG
jgi:hypothetical protein